jgi:hypothetical protein
MGLVAGLSTWSAMAKGISFTMQASIKLQSSGSICHNYFWYQPSLWLSKHTMLRQTL